MMHSNLCGDGTLHNITTFANTTTNVLTSNTSPDLSMFQNLLR